eukprot:CAMPEP_0171106590 /NCGR_PEP_ID=MMETSP0766_2-20121228/65075_1 /TAXON_ID=439317 /ORGANISM="Gambierdiscus australes, Strain CAWD 149" /LENGTH=430 /DNA_ID=CAMNT_0011567707 /DNA_START=42 /DNA_END=1334 /DNA_ORIENTATION=+
MRFTLLLSPLAPTAWAIDNGLGHTPPMGWRSWNLYGANVDQLLIESMMDAMVDRKRTVDGVPTSLCDLGYCDVGLDDNWQTCGGGQKYSFHDDSGVPIINQERFPDMIAMTAHAHKLGLTAGWYGNNCICRESREATEAMYRGDVAALTLFGFDAVKLDGCGTQYDLDLWARLLNGTGRPVMIENCHWGRTVPNATWCPWNFFRTSGDISANYGSVVNNLQTTVQWADKGLSRPGCWAYPDMLEVGCGRNGQPALSFAEMRSHFGAWAIVSSPLTLSHDLKDDKIMDLVWPVISNKEAIAINQAWAGHSGSPFKHAVETVRLDYESIVDDALVTRPSWVPKWQVFRKPLGGGKVAVLMLNHASHPQTLTLSFADVPSLSCTMCNVRDVWEQKDLSPAANFTAEDLAAHDSRFLVLSPITPKDAAKTVIVS